MFSFRCTSRGSKKTLTRNFHISRKGAYSFATHVNQVKLVLYIRRDHTRMNPSHDPSAALASLLAILAKSTQKNSLPSQPYSTHPPRPSHVEPVFTEGDILDTTQWIGIQTTPWYEPRIWQLRRPDNTTQRPQRAFPAKQKRSPSPLPELSSSTPTPIPTPTPATVKVFTSYSEALKHAVRQTQSEDFIDSIHKMKSRQNNLETDLFDQRSRITRKYESKRKMNELLKSLGSQYTNEQVKNLALFH